LSTLIQGNEVVPVGGFNGEEDLDKNATCQSYFAKALKSVQSNADKNRNALISRNVFCRGSALRVGGVTKYPIVLEIQRYIRRSKA